MNLEAIKAQLVRDKFQLIYTDLNGTIRDSCNTLMDLSGLLGKSLFEEFLLFESLEDVIRDLKPGAHPLEIPFVDFEYGDIRKNFHFSVSRTGNEQGSDGFLILIEGDKEFQRRLSEMQQQRNETVILLEKVEQQQRQLHESHQQLKKANTELDRFAYIVSHDLKSPLRGIGSLAGWIEEDLADGLEDEVSNHIKLLKKRVSRMESLIEGVLEYSRIGRQQVQTEVVVLAELLEEVVDNLSLPEHFEMVLPEMKVELQTSRTLLSQVLSNLIGNAIKYHHGSNPRIQVQVAAQNAQWLRFAVQDNGPGIDPRSHEKVFEIFQTLKSKDSYESTGIGLTIVKKIVEDQGGQIWLDSEPGQGATFYFTWPSGDLPSQ